MSLLLFHHFLFLFFSFFITYLEALVSFIPSRKNKPRFKRGSTADVNTSPAAGVLSIYPPALFSRLGKIHVPHAILRTVITLGKVPQVCMAILILHFEIPFSPTICNFVVPPPGRMVAYYQQQDITQRCAVGINAVPVSLTHLSTYVLAVYVGWKDSFKVIT